MTTASSMFSGEKWGHGAVQVKSINLQFSLKKSKPQSASVHSSETLTPVGHVPTVGGLGFMVSTRVLHLCPLSEKYNMSSHSMSLLIF